MNLHKVFMTLGHGVVARTKYGHGGSQRYVDRGVKSTIGNTPKEVADYLYTHFYDDVVSLIEDGKRPSVDRIDNNGHYTPDNIRIIDKDENSRLGSKVGGQKAKQMLQKPVVATAPDGTETVYPSAREAGEALFMSRAAVAHASRRGSTSQAGSTFSYL